MMFNDFGEEIRHGNKSDRVDLSKVAGCGDGDKTTPDKYTPDKSTPDKSTQLLLMLYMLVYP